MSGIMAVYSEDAYDDIHPLLYQGIMSLQHRGQKGFGYVIQDMAQYGNGLLSDVMIQSYKGNLGIASVRYAFSKDKVNEPLLPKQMGDYYIAYDGAYTDYENKLDDLECLHEILSKHQGAFAFVAINHHKMIAMRDCLGIKPLVMGKQGDTWFFASESCALQSINVTNIRDVAPGEMIVIDKHVAKSFHSENAKSAPCLFEYIYIARPDSTMNGVSVYQARKNMGKRLFEECPTNADVVMGAPDSGLIAALGYAQASGISYEKGIVKNRYVGRTFIEQDARFRKASVDIKLAAIPEAVSGKEIILVEDSIVRGTTIKKLIQILRDHGAKKVHVRVASPPVKFEENSSIDVPNKRDLMNYGKTVEEVREMIGCDSLYYLSLDGLKEAVGCKSFYTQYFDGINPFEGENNDL